MDQSELDVWHMTRALELAGLGQGYVEPNPAVGALVVRGAEIIGEGWHRRFGGPHAEIEALQVAGPRAEGATLYVTLEPCAHHGKTPPCVDAILAAGIQRVVVAQKDPFPEVSGGGLRRLRDAGVAVEVGLLEDAARRLNAPYLKLVRRGVPWIIAKWAMTLDGKLATRTGSSRWISGEASRRIAHELRGRADAVLVGRGTAEADDPLLTARPPGPRVATRVVLDTEAKLASDSQLARTCSEAPVLVAAGSSASKENRARLAEAGCEVFICEGELRAERLGSLLAELGRRRMTNVLVEGGAQVLGSLLDAGQIDEVHVFLATKLVGGREAPGPIAGEGIAEMADALPLDEPQVRPVGQDVYVHGRIRRGG